jgi:hypothetical protein
MYSSGIEAKQMKLEDCDADGCDLQSQRTLEYWLGEQGLWAKEERDGKGKT